MLLQGVQKVCSCVVRLISFEIYEQNTAKNATIEDYLANIVIIINTLRHSSQAAKIFVIVNINRLVWNNRNQICPKKPLFKKLLQIFRIWSSICCAIKTAWCAIKTSCWGKISTTYQILTPLFCSLEKRPLLTCQANSAFLAGQSRVDFFALGSGNNKWNYFSNQLGSFKLRLHYVVLSRYYLLIINSAYVHSYLIK